MHRFRVGTLECAVLNDGQIQIPPEIVFPPSRRAEWPLLELDGQGNITVALNCLLVRSAGKNVLVDTGNGTHPNKRFDGGGQLVSELAAAGLEPDDVDVVVITHAHVDHVGGMTTLRGGSFVPTFPRARHVVPRADWDYYTAPERAGQAAYVQDSLLPVAEQGQIDLVAGEFAVTPDIRLLPAPGHSPGNSVVLVTSEGETALHMGDLFHHRFLFENPDMVRDQDVLREMVPASRRRIAESALECSAQVIAAHEVHPGMGRLARREGRTVFIPTP